MIIELHPRRIGKRIQGARVISPEALERELGAAAASSRSPARRRERRSAPRSRSSACARRAISCARPEENPHRTDDAILGRRPGAGAAVYRRSALGDTLCAAPGAGARGGARGVVGLDRGGSAAALLGAPRPDRFLPGVPRRRRARGRRRRARRPRASASGASGCSSARSRSCCWWRCADALKRRLPAGDPRVDDTLVGEIALIHERLAAGAIGPAELRGTQWTARNDDASAARARRARARRARRGSRATRAARELARTARRRRRMESVDRGRRDRGARGRS